MKVFLSWSGELSRIIAEAFKELLESTLHETRPWMSSIDIATGNVWIGEIFSSLLEAKVGVLFLTLQNSNAPWLLFEAGALMKQVHEAKVCPLLIDFEPVDLKQPLAHFQASTLVKEDVLRIITSINKDLENPIENTRWEKTFDALWPNFIAGCNTAIEKSKEQTRNSPPKIIEDMIKESPDSIANHVYRSKVRSMM